MKTVVILFFLCSIGYSQKLHHHTLAAQGGVSATSTGVKVSQTIAQQGAIGTSISSKVILGQGFQQSKISKSAPIKTNLISTLVYPNPIVDVVNFKLSQPVEGKIAVSIFDINGRLVLFQEKEMVLKF